MCCACAGGSNGSCYDTNEGVGDVTGDMCDWYNAYPSYCGLYDTEFFTAKDMCCVCGGGSNPSGDWTISMSAKFERINNNKTTYTTYAAIGGTVLAAIFCANYAFKSKSKTNEFELV